MAIVNLAAGQSRGNVFGDLGLEEQVVFQTGKIAVFSALASNEWEQQKRNLRSEKVTHIMSVLILISLFFAVLANEVYYQYGETQVVSILKVGVTLPSLALGALVCRNYFRLFAFLGRETLKSRERQRRLKADNDEALAALSKRRRASIVTSPTGLDEAVSIEEAANQELTREQLQERVQYVIAFIVEFLVCVLHSPPSVSLMVEIPFADEPIFYNFDSLAVLFISLRIVLLFRSIREFFIFRDARTKLAAQIANVRTDSIVFTLKVALALRPFLILSLFFMVTLLWSSYAIRVSEMPVNESVHIYFWNSMWLVLVTISTVGYGDIVPETHLGRFSAFFAMAIGLVIASLLVSVFSNAVALDPNETRFVKHARDLEFRKMLRQHAALLIQAFSRYSSAVQRARQKQKKLRNDPSAATRKKNAANEDLTRTDTDSEPTSRTQESFRSNNVVRSRGWFKVEPSVHNSGGIAILKRRVDDRAKRFQEVRFEVIRWKATSKTFSEITLDRINQTFLSFQTEVVNRQTVLENKVAYAIERLNKLQTAKQEQHEEIRLLLENCPSDLARDWGRI